MSDYPDMEYIEKLFDTYTETLNHDFSSNQSFGDALEECTSIAETLLGLEFQILSNPAQKMKRITYANGTEQTVIVLDLDIMLFTCQVPIQQPILRAAVHIEISGSCVAPVIEAEPDHSPVSRKDEQWLESALSDIFRDASDTNLPHQEKE